MPDFSTLIDSFTPTFNDIFFPDDQPVKCDITVDTPEIIKTILSERNLFEDQYKVKVEVVSGPPEVKPALYSQKSLADAEKAFLETKKKIDKACSDLLIPRGNLYMLHYFWVTKCHKVFYFL